MSGTIVRGAGVGGLVLSTSSLVPLAACVLAACGGNVIVDAVPGASSSSGGLGGAGTATTIASAGAGAAGSCGSTRLHGEDPLCEACTEMNCCSLLAACGVGSPCFQTLDCLANCNLPDTGCNDTCLAMSPDNGQALTALTDCFDAACSYLDPCHFGTGKVCDSGLGASSTCGTCLTIACCGQAEACGQSAPCQNCLAVQAMQGCDPTYDALLGCQQSFCANVCS